MNKKIYGVTVCTPLPKSDLNQTDPTKGDYVKGKDEFLKDINSGVSGDGTIIDAATGKPYKLVVMNGKLMLDEAASGGASSVPISDYWNVHLTEKIARIKELQREGGKDSYSFVVIADYHRYGNIGKKSPALIRRIMDECGIKFCLCLGDIQNGGAWKTKELELAEWEEIEKEFAPIRDRTLMIPGNHDGAYGSEDINGDGVISGTTDYYIYNLTPNEVYDLILRKVGLINGVTFDESYNGYYADDPVSKVRYILVNTHYSDGETDENGIAVNNYMRKIRVGQSQVDMVIDALNDISSNDWNVVVGMHIPLAEVGDSGPSGDMVLLRNVLEAYQKKAAYAGTFGTPGNYDYISIDVDFSNAKGNVVGAFCGHVHNDFCNLNYEFPIITSYSDDTTNTDESSAGTITEQSFDVFTVNKRTGVINATKIGYGEDRIFGAPEVPEALYTNLANPNSADWYSESHYINTDGALIEETNAVYNATVFVTNFIPVVKTDILRWKGINRESLVCGYRPGIKCYDENKNFIRNVALSTADIGSASGLPASCVADENGVTAWEIMIRGDTNAQFTYDNLCDKIRYVRFCAHWLTTEDDIIITVNEEIT